MTEHDLIAAIRNDYDNDALRLSLAGWYEQNGQPDRGEFIRACVITKRYPFNSPEYEQAIVRRRRAWMNCRPSYWHDMGPGGAMNLIWDLGMYIVSFADGKGTFACTPRAIKEVGGQRWLGKAYEQGWLLRMDMRFDDGSLGKYVSKWRPPVGDIPLWVKPAPTITDDGLDTIFSLPQLCGLSFFSETLGQAGAVLSLGRLKKLRRLKMDIRGLSAQRWAALMEQILMLDNLYELKIEAEWNEAAGLRPTDDDVRKFERLKSLKKLDLVKATAVSAEAVAALKAAKPDLRISHTT